MGKGKRIGASMSFKTVKEAGVTIVPKDKLGRRFWEQAITAKRQRAKWNAIHDQLAAPFDPRPRLVKKP